MPNPITRFAGKTFFRLTGWTHDDPTDLLEDKQVIIGFPHTTNMDTIRALAMFMAVGLKTFTLMKREVFFWPLSWILRLVGAIPVDRANSSQVVPKLAEEFKQRKQFTLVIAPEGTRGKAGQKPAIRTGFWHIAKAANVPIVLMMADNVACRGRFLGKVMPTDLQENLLTIQKLYHEAGIDIVIPQK
jgi:hypothetical protein